MAYFFLESFGTLIALVGSPNTGDINVARWEQDFSVRLKIPD
jgi:hypothetical protein